MQQHIESNNIVLLTKLLKFEQIVTLIAVKCQQLALAYPTLCCVLNKVL